MSPTIDNDPQFYIPDPGLEVVLDMAIHLGMPLLLTGEPGTGKTSLAKYVAWKENARYVRFNTKTSSKARDLLYRYNALTHFRDANMKEGEASKTLNPMDYIVFEALGEAIMYAGQKRYVVLVDEIDKAPRDFPNDILFEFEELAFRVDEASKQEIQDWLQGQESPPILNANGFFSFGDERKNRPILILTSNSEKNLPDAFLRRCAFYHIPFPEKEQLMEILNNRLKLEKKVEDKMVNDAVDHFLEIRDYGLRKSPATAELISWIHILAHHNIDISQRKTDEEIRKQVEHTYSILAKSKEDLEKIIAEAKDI